MNKNDYLDKIYFYNAGAYLINGSYIVNGFIYPNNDVSVEVGLAEYDQGTDRLIFTASESICISTIDYLQLAKQP